MPKTRQLSSLPVGAKVKFGTMYGEKLVWKIAEKNHNGYPENSVNILTEQYVAILAFDAAEPYAETSDMRWYGRGRYGISNINKWLQAKGSAGNWYSAQHPVDHAPSRGYVYSDPYESFAGFLSEFDEREIAMLMPTTRKVGHSSNFGSYYDTVTSKMFIYTNDEIGYASQTKDVIEYMRTGSNRTTTPSAAAIEHAQSLSSRTLSTDSKYKTLTATGYPNDREKVYHVNTSGSHESAYAYESAGVRPSCNLPADTLVTYAMDENACYTVIVNSAPTEPSPISLKYDDDTLAAGYIRSGKTITVSWGRSTDVDDNLDHYELERKYGDDGEWTQVYSGTARQYSETAKYGEDSITFRVRAVDYYDLTSDYVTASTLNIWSNEPPELSVTQTALGTFQMSGPTLTYKYADPDETSDTLKIYLDGKEYRSLTLATTETEKTGTFTFTADEWLKVQNGSHTIKLVLTDTHSETATVSATFTKEVPKIVFQRMKPVGASELPTEIIVRVNGEYPEDNIKVEVCNNANDASPTWEDMTEEFLDEDIYTFTNEAKTGTNWGVNFRVTIERGTATGDIYVESVTCNFLAGDSETSARVGGTSVTYENNATGQTLIVG